MKNPFFRLLRVLFLASTIFISLTFPVYAADATGNFTYLDDMGDAVFQIYRFFLRIVIILVILSLAYYGIQIIASIFFGNSKAELDKIKRRALLMFAAVVCLAVLPNVIGWAKDSAMPQAWVPPTPAPLETVPPGSQNNNPGTSGNQGSGEAVTPVTPEEIALFQAGSRKGSYTSTQYNRKMDYYIHIPQNAGKGMPLIVWLHGSGSVGKVDALENKGVIQAAKNIYGENFPFIVLSPCAYERSWSGYNTPEVLKALIDDVASTYSVNKGKIIITGHSMGAGGVWTMASRYNTYFSCAVGVSGGATSELNYDNLAKQAIYVVCGTEEGNAIYNETHLVYQKIFAKIPPEEGTGGLHWKSLRGMNHAQTSTGAYDRSMFEWMLDHSTISDPYGALGGTASNTPGSSYLQGGSTLPATPYGAAAQDPNR